MRWRLRIIFVLKNGYFLRLNPPVTFNEKVQYRKLFDRDDSFPIYVDKVEVKKYLESKIDSGLYIPKTLFVADRVEELLSLDFNKLPFDYVIKANHTSQTMIIVRNGQHPSYQTLMDVCSKWLKEDQFTTLGEWAYSKVPRKIFIEEFLDFEGSSPTDYKFFVYNGKVHFIQVDIGRFTCHRRNMYDRDWNLLGFEYSHKQTSSNLEPPIYIGQLIKMAERIGRNLDFARVDLYYYNDQVTFSEITLYPGAGFERFPSTHSDEMFGKPWKIEILN